MDASQSISRDLPPSPPRPSPRQSRRSSGIRVLDAFGKELPQGTKEPTQGQVSSEDVPSVVDPMQDSAVQRSPSRRRGTIRVLDAMGRVVQDPSIESRRSEEDTMSKDESDERLDQQQAKELLRRTISSLRDDVAELERCVGPRFRCLFRDY